MNVYLSIYQSLYIWGERDRQTETERENENTDIELLKEKGTENERE